jgi:hypothetical protein
MATVDTPITNTEYTQVLDGAGHINNIKEIRYLFAATQPAVTTEGIPLMPFQQVNGKTGEIMWAKCVGFESDIVFSNPEA